MELESCWAGTQELMGDGDIGCLEVQDIRPWCQPEDAWAVSGAWDLPCGVKSGGDLPSQHQVVFICREWERSSQCWVLTEVKEVVVD